LRDVPTWTSSMWLCATQSQGLHKSGQLHGWCSPKTPMFSNFWSVHHSQGDSVGIRALWRSAASL
jgi:hypothetical protein